MGNATAKQIKEQNNNLIVRTRLLEKQIKECSNINPVVDNAITFVKQAKKYTSIILPGGGISSLSSVYMMEYLVENGYTEGLEAIGASSFASIVAVLYAIGASIDDIKRHIRETSWSKIFQTTSSKGIVSDIYHIATEYGHCDGTLLSSLLSEWIEYYTGNKHYTLGDVLKDNGINLVISAVELSSRCMIYFNATQHADIPLRVILRAACTIPDVMCPIIIDGHYLVDSSISDLCPYYLFDAPHIELYNYHVQVGSVPINPNNLSFMLIRDMPLGNNALMSDITSQHKTKIRNVMSYRNTILDIATSSQYDKFITPENRKRLVMIHIPCYDITMTTLSQDDLRIMESSIRSALMNYFH